MGTIVVSLVILGIVVLIVRNMIKVRRQGKSVQCGCDCAHCGGRCH